MSQPAAHRFQAILLAASVAAAIGFLSCAPEERHRILVFFFDGVPPLHPGTETVELSAGGKGVAPDTAAVRRPAKAAQDLYEHKPGREGGQCGACHDSRNAYRLVKPLGELCHSCHERETRSFARMHGPVAFGDCAACHEAHRSPYKALVKEPGAKLCFRCHERAPKDGRPPGCTRASDEVNCVTCHDPHGGATPVFLARRGAAAAERKAAPSPPPGRAQ